MALRDVLNLVNEVSVVKKVSTGNGMGGTVTTTTTTVIPLAALWQTGSNNRWLSDLVYKSSSDILCFEYGAYNFDVAVSGATIVETVSYNGKAYKRVGFANDVMQLHEIVVQGLERLS